MNKYVWMSLIAVLAGVAMVIAWGYINFPEYGWKSVWVFFFGYHCWLLLLAGIPLFGVLNSAIDSFVNTGYEIEKREIDDYRNMMLHAEILKNQDRLAALFREKKVLKAQEIELQAREAEVADKELAIKKTATLEKKFEESKNNNKLLKQENIALKNENVHLKKSVKKS